MGKIKGYNVRLYLGENLLMHTTEVSMNFVTDTEEVTDAESGDWKENAPTLNSWSVDTSFWYSNTDTEAAEVHWIDIMNIYLAQTPLTLVCQLEEGDSTTWAGAGYLINLSPSGGTGANYVKCSAGFIGTAEIS